MSVRSPGRILLCGLPVTGAAVLANLAYLSIFTTLGMQVFLPLDEAGTHFGPMPVQIPLLTTAALGLAATLFYGLLIRIARRPGVVFVSVALTALLVSFGAPASLPPGIPAGTRWLLAGMIIQTAVIVTGGLLLSGHAGKIPQRKTHLQ
jgi:hypothetical protein